MLHSSGVHDFDQDFREIHVLATAPVTNEQELAHNLNQIYQTIFNVDFGRYDLPTLHQSAQTIIKTIFGLRIHLHSQIPNWKQHDIFSLDVQKALRNVFRASRYATDMVGEFAIGYDRLDKGEEIYPAFGGPNFFTLTHPAFTQHEPLSFQSGDVLLVRGKHHNSAAIARIGDIDSQFSHLAIIHVDITGKRWVVESLIEEGAIITPLEYALSHGIARAALFRYRNPDIAHRASQTIYNKVLKSQNIWRRSIPYDFSMNLKDYKSLFCSKLVRQAYDEATKGKIKLASHLTKLDMKNRDFLNRIGVSVTETFAPGDIEIEPGFDLVAEWRDYRETSGLRLQDLTMDKFFQWMDEHDYNFHEDYFIHLIGVFGKASSYLSKTAKHLVRDVVPKVPKNMSRRTIATVVMLHKTAENVYQELRAVEQKHIQETGRPLHPRLVRKYLEHLRERSDGKIGYLVRSV